MMNKKAVSAVVATVLIIMITVAAVGIIWAAIIPMIRNSIDKGTACFDAQSDVSLVVDSGYTCIKNNETHNCDASTTGDSQCGNVSVQIKKGPNDKISLVGVNVLVIKGGNSITERIDSGLPSNNEEKVFHIDNETYFEATSVKIAPIVTVGKTEQVCDVSQEVILAPCSN